MHTENSGMCWTNSLVPSSGSTTQTRRLASRVLESAVSSESQPSSGKAAATSARMRDRRVAVADDRVRQALGVDLAPAHGLARRRAREAAGVDARVGELDVVVVPLLRDAEHLLHLRLGLEEEVLGRAPAEDQHARLAARALGAEHDGGGLVHVA